MSLHQLILYISYPSQRFVSSLLILHHFHSFFYISLSLYKHQVRVCVCEREREGEGHGSMHVISAGDVWLVQMTSSFVSFHLGLFPKMWDINILKFYQKHKLSLMNNSKSSLPKVDVRKKEKWSTRFRSTWVQRLLFSPLDIYIFRVYIPWRRKWQPISIFSPRKSHGERSLVGYSPWGRKESDMTGD